MILENKGTPDIIENIINNNKTDIVDCVKKLSMIKLHIDEYIVKSDINRSLKCDVEIRFIQGVDYKGNINYLECLNSKFKGCIINIYLPKTYDLSSVIKTLSHELTHLYELYQINDKFDTTKWKWQEALDDIAKEYKLKGHLLYFRDIIYLSLPQELNARVSSIYFYLTMNSRINDSKEKIIKILEESREWQNYINLVKFNPNVLSNDMFNYYGENIDFTFVVINELNKNLGIEFKITNINQLSKYFKNLDKIFKKSAEKYKNKLLRVVDRVYEERNKQFEYLTNDPGNVDYDQYTKTIKIDERDYNLQNLLEYSDFIKEISKI